MLIRYSIYLSIYLPASQPAENEPSKVCCKGLTRSGGNSWSPYLFAAQAGVRVESDGRVGGLAPTRGLGDKDVKDTLPAGAIVPEPEVPTPLAAFTASYFRSSLSAGSGPNHAIQVSI